MHFIILLKFKGKLDKALYQRIREIARTQFEGIKPYGLYFMMGSYDAVWHIEAESFTAAASLLNTLREVGETIMMPAFSLDEAAETIKD